MVRYAIYWAPEPGEPLAEFGASWLGRDAETGALRSPPRIVQADPASVAEVTAEPRRYGFHATLKPPFALKSETNVRDLLEAVRSFAAERASFALPTLRLASIDGFLALVPAERSDALQRLADECVRAFDGFRAPPLAAELARRRRAPLSPRQDGYLERWGYP